jgi:hypothetical protein
MKKYLLLPSRTINTLMRALQRDRIPQYFVLLRPSCEANVMMRTDKQ